MFGSRPDVSHVPLSVNLGPYRWSASWLMTLAVAVCVALFVQLGRWQWHRAEQANQKDYAYAAGAAAATMAFTGHSAASMPRYSAVVAQGHYDSAHQFLLDNMTVHGSAGYEVLTPLELSDGRTLLVNRGWVPLTDSRASLPNVAVATGAVRVSGRLDDLPVVGIALGHVPPPAAGPWPRVTSFPTVADLSAALGRPLEARQLLLDPAEPLGFVRDWMPVDSAPAEHLSYAAQWWIFALITLGLYVYLNRERPPGWKPPRRGPDFHPRPTGPRGAAR